MVVICYTWPVSRIFGKRFLLTGLDSYTFVYHGYGYVFRIGSDAYGNCFPRRGVLECIGEQIEKYFLKFITIYPYI